MQAAPFPLTRALGFNGQYLERNGYYVPGSYRAYSPTLRRFCRPDGFSPFGAGGLNPYAYCLGDPVNRIDPDGRVSRNVLAVVSVASVVATLGFIVGAVLAQGEVRDLLIVASVVGALGALGSAGGVWTQHGRMSSQRRVSVTFSAATPASPAAVRLPSPPVAPRAVSLPPSYSRANSPAVSSGRSASQSPPPGYESALELQRAAARSATSSPSPAASIRGR